MNLLRPLQLGLQWLEDSAPESQDWIECDGNRFPVLYRRNHRAQRFRLFVDREGRPRVTVPRRGSLRDARQFVGKHREWLVEQLRRFQARDARARHWHIGCEILFRGALCRLGRSADESALFLVLGGELIEIPRTAEVSEFGFREVVEAHLQKLAATELPLRVSELAALHQCPVQRVTVRNQRSRWGSCSRLGTISLNWRLIQAPADVRDYIILHELMHLREMNHSLRFWALVTKVCPEYESAEEWLRSHSSLLA